ncbi:hypothetical protein B0H14DRAFT_2742937 [Mycena olivaceomarginata]|nr:hypothetical protein B0H14DRAFT_2742937 [Mycena olivaceomarginata]
MSGRSISSSHYNTPSAQAHRHVTRFTTTRPARPLGCHHTTHRAPCLRYTRPHLRPTCRRILSVALRRPAPTLRPPAEPASTSPRPPSQALRSSPTRTPLVLPPLAATPLPLPLPSLPAPHYIRVIFISQPQYKNLIPMFGIVNEAYLPGIERDALTSLYATASIHNGFQGTASLAGFLPGSDRIILDTYPYFAFDGAPNNIPIATSRDPPQAGEPWPKQTQSAFGVTVAGEISNGYNEFGLYLTGVNGTQSYGA